MNKAQVEEVSRVLFGLAGNFGDTLDELTVKMWLQSFKHSGITASQVKKASFRILRTRKIAKMPTYAEFVEYIEGSYRDKAEQQADLVLDYLRKNGHKANPGFEDKITAYLMETRWPYRQWGATLKEERVPFWRNDFIQAYQSCARNPRIISPNYRLEAEQHVQGLLDDIGCQEPEKEREEVK